MNGLPRARRLGQGNWAFISMHYDFQGRSPVDLKDKWRTLLRADSA